MKIQGNPGTLPSGLSLAAIAAGFALLAADFSAAAGLGHGQGSFPWAVCNSISHYRNEQSAARLLVGLWDSSLDGHGNC